jgi:uncharacterized protein
MTAGLSLLQRARAGEVLADLDIVDMHGHLGGTYFAITRRLPEDLVAVMDRVGVRQIVCSHISCMCARAEAGNRETLAAMRAHPGRILGYVILWPQSAKDVERETRWCLAQGFTGIKLHNSNGFPYADPAYAPALEIADERRLPVLLHTWGRAEELAHARVLAQKYSRASLLLAHTGMAAIEEYIRLARELPNVYLDTCGSRYPFGMLDRLVSEVGAGKVVWGSDGNFFSVTHQIGKVFGARCDDAAKCQVLSGNARRILGAIVR